MVYYSEHFKELEKKCNFPEEAVKVFDEVAQRLDSDKKLGAEFEKIRKGYMFPRAHNLGRKFIPRVEALAEANGINKYTLDMVFVMVCAELLHKRYKRKGLSDELFWAGCDDFRCKLLECMECEEVPGTFVAGWNDGFFAVNRFALGRFQYEYDRFPVDFTTSAGVKIKKGTKCINFHIPSSGIPLTDDVRLDSYKKAYEFFADQRTPEGYLILKCSSWLLYPRYKEFLFKESNILKFQSDFELYEAVTRDDFGDAWRVFGKYSDSPVEEYPENTKLRRAFKQWLLSGEKTGYGCGVIVFDGEKIIR